MTKDKEALLKQYIEEFKIDKTEEMELSDKGFLSIKRYKSTLKNGKIIIREQILKGGKTGSASIVIPVTEEGNIVVIVESRAITEEGFGIEFPAGYIEECETPAEAANRELLEETGYEPKKLKQLVSYYQDQGCSKAYNHIFIAFGCKKTKDQNLDSDELIKYMEFTFEEVLELAEKGYINDSNSLLALEKAKEIFLKEMINYV